MIRDLEHADSIVKLTLAGATLLCYGLGILSGFVANVLAILAIAVIILAIVRSRKRKRDG